MSLLLGIGLPAYIYYIMLFGRKRNVLTEAKGKEKAIQNDRTLFLTENHSPDEKSIHF
jgi:hypothetical protein